MWVFVCMKGGGIWAQPCWLVSYLCCAPRKCYSWKLMMSSYNEVPLQFGSPPQRHPASLNSPWLLLIPPWWRFCINCFRGFLDRNFGPIQRLIFAIVLELYTDSFIFKSLIWCLIQFVEELQLTSTNSTITSTLLWYKDVGRINALPAFT